MDQLPSISQAWATIIAAVIGGICTLAAAYITTVEKGRGWVLLTVVTFITTLIVVLFFGAQAVEDENLTLETKVSPETQHEALERAWSFNGGNDDWTRFADKFDGVEMVLVPVGCFMMGSEAGGSDEKPVHQVCFEEPFWIGRTEVTNAQYKQCVDAGGCSEPGNTTYYDYDDARFADHPVVYVDFVQANAYARWLGKTTGTEVQLPTEAQWEYAARGPNGLIYPWGNSDPTCTQANITSCVGGTSPVGSYPLGASWVGALDMSGNVREWVADWYNSYPVAQQVDPGGPFSGNWRVVRGGSLFDDGDSARAAYRRRYDSSHRYFNIGFRVEVSSSIF